MMHNCSESLAIAKRACPRAGARADADALCPRRLIPHPAEQLRNSSHAPRDPRLWLLRRGWRALAAAALASAAALIASRVALGALAATCCRWCARLPAVQLVEADQLKREAQDEGEVAGLEIICMRVMVVGVRASEAGAVQVAEAAEAAEAAGPRTAAYVHQLDAPCLGKLEEEVEVVRTLSADHWLCSDSIAHHLDLASMDGRCGESLERLEQTEGQYPRLNLLDQVGDGLSAALEVGVPPTRECLELDSVVLLRKVRPEVAHLARMGHGRCLRHNVAPGKQGGGQAI